MSSQSQTSTTFIQADTATFRHLVQQLTGLPGDPNKPSPANPHSKPSPKTPNRRSPFKLQDRRAALRTKLEVQFGLSAAAAAASDHRGHHSPRKTHRLGSPGLSPVTPLGSETAFFWKMNLESPAAAAASEEEEKAIAEKGFYLHPSPANTPRGHEPPELLPLFPVTSPEQDKQGQERMY